MAKQKKSQADQAQTSKLFLPPNYNILALDLSLTGTGWARPSTFPTSSVNGIETGLITTGDTKDIWRMRWVREQILPLLHCSEILGVKPLIDVVFVEEFSFGSKGAALFEIAGLGYLIRDLLVAKHIPYFPVPPTMIKKFTAGKGNVDKNVMLKEVYKRWAFDTNDDNIADAYALYRLGQCVTGALETSNEAQAAVVSTLKKLYSIK